MSITSHGLTARKFRRRSIDRSVPMTGKAKSDRVDLGLALLELVAKPRVGLSQEDLALWCGCSRGAIYLMEMRALKKLRNKIMFGRAREAGRELVA